MVLRLPPHWPTARRWPSARKTGPRPANWPSARTLALGPTTKTIKEISFETKTPEHRERLGHSTRGGENRPTTTTTATTTTATLTPLTRTDDDGDRRRRMATDGSAYGTTDFLRQKARRRETPNLALTTTRRRRGPEKGSPGHDPRDPLWKPREGRERDRPRPFTPCEACPTSNHRSFGTKWA